MATPKTQSAPAPAPSVTEQANASIAAAKTGVDPLKPLRYAIAFAWGTLRDGLGGIRQWGGTGLKWGLALGILVAIAAPVGMGIAALTACALGGFALGVVGGGAHGLTTGGMRAVGRIHRAEKYAEDLIVRDKQQRYAAPSRADFRRRRAAEREERDFQEQRQFMERQNEIERDARTYGSNPYPSFQSSDTSWVDRVSNSNTNQGMGL